MFGAVVRFGGANGEPDNPNSHPRTVVDVLRQYARVCGQGAADAAVSVKPRPSVCRRSSGVTVASKFLC